MPLSMTLSTDYNLNIYDHHCILCMNRVYKEEQYQTI